MHLFSLPILISPNFFNGYRQRIQDALYSMSKNGYNLVRVFLDKGDGIRDDSIAGNVTSSLPFGESYIDNVAQFIRYANVAGLKVIPP